MTGTGVLVAGIGNIGFGDDGFGAEVAHRLVLGDLPGGVRVGDYGLRSVDLAYDVLDGYANLILVDAVALGESPGTVAVVAPDTTDTAGLLANEAAFVDAWTITPEVVLSTLVRLGGRLDSLFVVGCEPENLRSGVGLSPRVAAAVEGAVEVCTQLIADLTGQELSMAKRPTPGGVGAHTRSSDGGERLGSGALEEAVS